MLKKLDRAEFDAIFSIMEQSFPLDEYRAYEEQKALFVNPEYEIYTWHEKEEEPIAAFAAVWEFDNMVFLEHLAVDLEYRNGGIGAKVLQALKQIFDKKICLEVELPETDLAKRRIGFYERNGFFLNSYDYIQPSLSKGRNPIPLLIMTTGRRIEKEEFVEIRDALYEKVYGVIKKDS